MSEAERAMRTVGKVLDDLHPIYRAQLLEGLAHAAGSALPVEDSEGRSAFFWSPQRYGVVSTDYSPPMLDENTEPKLGPDPKEIAAARRSMSELAFAEAGMDRKKLKKAVTARSTDAPVK